MKLTVAIISKSIPNDRLIKSLSFAQEILVVVDSNDERDLKKGKIVFFFHPLKNDFAQQRNFALSKAKGDWVLFIDDDEIVSSELGQEIRSKITNTTKNSFLIPRIDIVYHQALRNGETGTIKILRLGKKNAGSFIRPVHEVWKIKGSVGELTSPLYHRKDHFVSEFIARMNQYGQLDAPILAAENKPYSPFRLFLNPLLKFLQNYFLRRGFLDGYPGLFLAYLMSIQSLSVRVFQWTNKNLS